MLTHTGTEKGYPRFGPMEVTLEGMQVVANRQALPEPFDVAKETLIARGPAMFMNPSEEPGARLEPFKRPLR